MQVVLASLHQPKSEYYTEPEGAGSSSCCLAAAAAAASLRQHHVQHRSPARRPPPPPPPPPAPAPPRLTPATFPPLFPCPNQGTPWPASSWLPNPCRPLLPRPTTAVLS